MCVKSFTTDRGPPTYRYPIFIQYKPSQPIGDHPLWPCTLRCHQTWLAMGNPLWYCIVGKSSRNGGFNLMEQIIALNGWCSSKPCLINALISGWWFIPIIHINCWWCDQICNWTFWSTNVFHAGPLESSLQYTINSINRRNSLHIQNSKVNVPTLRYMPSQGCFYGSCSSLFRVKQVLLLCW